VTRNLKVNVIISLIFILLLSSAFLYNDGPTLKYLKLVVPKGWPKPSSDIFKNNPLTEEGFQLGRKLFYDGRLSKDGNIACASCHQQFAAFSTYDHDLSHGFNNSFTTRNAPALFNLAWMKELQWDGAINHIEMQPLAPMTASNEMAETIENVLQKISADSSYKRMFKAAFVKGSINSQNMLRALAQFTGSIQSYNTKYDKMKRGEVAFTVSEQFGYNVFRSRCNSCHAEPLFTDNSFRNNGIGVGKNSVDLGRAAITNDAADSFKFKVPSLRNIVLTAPYMHDGRFFTLSQVIEHYRKIKTSDAKMETVLKGKIEISKQEKVDLFSFLNTLTDEQMVKDKRYADPQANYKLPMHQH
jgi:cytochrome c peroxidase